MRRRLCGAALAVGAVLLGPFGDTRERATDHEEVRLVGLAATHEAAEARLTRSASAQAEEEFPPPPASAHAIPLRGGGTHLIVDGTLNGVLSGPMLVDTGASYCVLTRKTARKLGLVPHGRRTIPVTTANGRIDAGVVALDAIELRDARLAGVDAVVMDAVEPPFIGIIGLNFLTRFRFSVDATEGVLRLER